MISSDEGSVMTWMSTVPGGYPNRLLLELTGWVFLRPFGFFGSLFVVFLHIHHTYALDMGEKTIATRRSTSLGGVLGRVGLVFGRCDREDFGCALFCFRTPNTTSQKILNRRWPSINDNFTTSKNT